MDIEPGGLRVGTLGLGKRTSLGPPLAGAVPQTNLSPATGTSPSMAVSTPSIHLQLKHYDSRATRLQTNASHLCLTRTCLASIPASLHLLSSLTTSASSKHRISRSYRDLPKPPSTNTCLLSTATQSHTWAGAAV